MQCHASVARTTPLTPPPQIYCLQLVGDTLYTGSRDSTARSWDANTGATKFIFRGHKKGKVAGTGGVTCLAVIGTTLYTSSSDGTMMTWDTETGQLNRMLEGHHHWVHLFLVIGQSQELDPAEMKIVELQEACRQFGLDDQGTKGPMIRRLQGHLAANPMSAQQPMLYSGSFDKVCI